MAQAKIRGVVDLIAGVQRDRSGCATLLQRVPDMSDLEPLDAFDVMASSTFVLFKMALVRVARVDCRLLTDSRAAQSKGESRGGETSAGAAFRGIYANERVGVRDGPVPTPDHAAGRRSRS